MLNRDSNIYLADASSWRSQNSSLRGAAAFNSTSNTMVALQLQQRLPSGRGGPAPVGALGQFQNLLSPQAQQKAGNRGTAVVIAAAASDESRAAEFSVQHVTNTCWSWGGASPLQQLRAHSLPALEELQLQTSEDALDACRRTVCDLLGQLSAGFHVNSFHHGFFSGSV